MRLIQLGSRGSKISEIQSKLNQLDIQAGPVDGIFGRKTRSAVLRFQTMQGLETDGVVGTRTRQALMDKGMKTAADLLIYKCLAVTGLFETGKKAPESFAALSGNFDGQGMSMGVLQWNFGQGTLTTLLKRMQGKHPDILRAIFKDYYADLVGLLGMERKGQLKYLDTLQDKQTFRMLDPWKSMFKALGCTREFQMIQLVAAQHRFCTAVGWRKEYALYSARAAALMFDINVQNGSISKKVKARIMADYAKVPASLSAAGKEAERMRIVANRRAEAARPQWIEDVRSRKLCVALGKGRVHGREYDLSAYFPPA